MSENHPSDVRLDEGNNGSVSFATDVIATIAGLAATEVEGVATMAGSSGTIAEMFSRKGSRNLTKGVRIELIDNAVTVDITITVEYGFPIPRVANGIQENVKKAIETMTGLATKEVNIHVAGMSFENELKAAKELDEAQKKMLDESKPAEEAPEEKEELVEEKPEEEPEEVIEVQVVAPVEEEDDEEEETKEEEAPAPVAEPEAEPEPEIIVVEENPEEETDSEALSAEE